jgi:hypothetical protein
MSAMPRPIFEIYVDDDRYAVPTLHLVPADDEATAREIVSRLLEENAHHRGAELCFEGQLILGVGTFEVAPRVSRA